MPIVNKSNLDAVETAANTALNSIFDQGFQSTFEQFTTRVDGSGESFVHMVLVDGFPVIREWTQGSKYFKSPRAYKLEVSRRRWERSVRVPLDDIEGDSSGVIAQRMGSWAGRVAQDLDKIVFDELLGNPTGYDGVSLLNNSHPNTGGTTDNLQTAAITFSLFNTARVAMREVADEDGEPIDIIPTLLVVGPDQERIAQEITGSDRWVGIDTSGAQDQTSNVNAAVLLPNFVGGSVSVISTPRITGNEWFLMDTSKGDAKPFALVDFRTHQVTFKDDPSDDNVFFNDELLASIDLKASPAAGAWQCIHGSVTA